MKIVMKIVMTMIGREHRFCINSGHLETPTMETPPLTHNLPNDMVNK